MLFYLHTLLAINTSCDVSFVVRTKHTVLVSLHGIVSQDKFKPMLSHNVNNTSSVHQLHDTHSGFCIMTGCHVTFSVAGFLQQFAAVCHPDRPELNIAAVLRELSGGQTPTRVICCGHSLGGALATLGK